MVQEQHTQVRCDSPGGCSTFTEALEPLDDFLMMAIRELRGTEQTNVDTVSQRSRDWDQNF